MLLSPRAATAVVGPGRGWAIVCALGVTQVAGYGVLVYAFGVLLEPMRRDLGLSATVVTGAFSLAILVSGLAAPLVGRLLDRHDPRWLMGGGSMLASVLVLGWSQVDGAAALYLVFAGIGMAMALVLYEPAFTVVAKWFDRRRTRALTVLTLVGALASFVFSPLTERLVDAHGWRIAVVVLGLILAASTVPLHALVLRAPPPEPGATTRTAGIPSLEVSLGRGFWLLGAVFGLSSFASVALTVHLVSMLVADGLSLSFAATVAGLLGLCQIVGRLVHGLVVHALGIGNAIVAVHGLAAGSIALLAFGETWAVLAFAVLFGACNGMATLLRATLVADRYGTRDYGAISGRLSAIVLGARAAAPLAAAAIALLPGHYRALVVALAAGSVAAALLARAAPSPPTPPLTNPFGGGLPRPRSVRSGEGAVSGGALQG